MTLSQQITNQFNSIINECEDIKRKCGWDGREFYHHPNSDDYYRIRTQALNLIKIACGENSEHLKEIRRLAEGKDTSTNSYYFTHLLGIIQAANNDFKIGLLFDVESRVRADVLDDFLDQANFLLGEKCCVAAASLAGAVLEDTLRKICDLKGINYPDKTKIDSLNSLLAQNKVYDKLVQKQITAYADLRNNADHGHFDKVRQEDVKDFLQWLNRFAMTYLSVQAT